MNQKQINTIEYLSLKFDLIQELHYNPLNLNFKTVIRLNPNMEVN